MYGEIQRFIKVWVTAISCLCYCYYIAARIPKGLFRFLSLIPIVFLFIILPFNLSSAHLGGFTIFFLSWLATFKLLLFSFDQGPLSQSPLSIFHFISIASLPIKLKQNSPSKLNNYVTQSQLLNESNSILVHYSESGFKRHTHPSHETTQISTTNPKKSEPHDNGSSRFAKSVSVGIKLLLLAMIIRANDYKENLHPGFTLALFCCHVYLALVTALSLSAMLARSIIGLELEPQFNKPYLATSLQDFWGRRWNLMVTNILRPSVYLPLRRLFTPVLGPAWGLPAAIFATFVVSGVMHEFIYYYLTRAPPTWEVTWFFVLHGVWTATEVAVKKAVVHRGWRLHRLVSWSLTFAFLVVTGELLFFNQLLRNGLDRRVTRECAIVVDFVKSKLSCLAKIND